MSLIPIVIFGLVVLTAIAGHFVEKKHGVSKDELATLLAPMVSLFAAVVCLCCAEKGQTR